MVVCLPQMAANANLGSVTSTHELKDQLKGQ